MVPSIPSMNSAAPRQTNIAVHWPATAYASAPSGHAAPLKVITIVDDTRRLLRAPEVRFAASEIGLEAFGHNIENRLLIAALQSRASELAGLTWIEDEAEELELGDQTVTARLKAGGTATARLAVGADGQHSLCRTAAGISAERRTYAQTALTFNLRHARP